MDFWPVHSTLLSLGIGTHTIVRVCTAVAPAVSRIDKELAHFLWEHKCLAKEHAQLEQLRAISAIPCAALSSSELLSVGSASDDDSEQSCSEVASPEVALMCLPISTETSATAGASSFSNRIGALRDVSRCKRRTLARARVCGNSSIVNTAFTTVAVRIMCFICIGIFF